jgi:hypothetical protein
VLEKVLVVIGWSVGFIIVGGFAWAGVEMVYEMWRKTK